MPRGQEFCYGAVASWVDRTHLSGRLVYFRVRGRRPADLSGLHPDSLVRKLAIKPDSEFYAWLEAELAHRFDFACCASIEQFRREKQAVTRADQVKTGGERHEKDDRYRIDDRSRYVLGWSNAAKIAALEKRGEDLARRMQAIAGRIAEHQQKQRALQRRLEQLSRLEVFSDFHELDWRPLGVDIEALERERKQLEAESDLLRTLEQQLAALEERQQATEEQLDATKGEHARTEEKRDQASALLQDARTVLEATPASAREHWFPRLVTMRDEALGEHTLTVESCENRQSDMRTWLQARIDAEERKLSRLAERIVKAMEAYCQRYPLETQEVDVSVAAAGDYGRMLEELVADDLPRFEARFKALLNENTIREVASFQAQLNRERQAIRERIDTINRSLHEIDYNPGRYIALLAEPAAEVDIRDFQQELRSCTEGALTGSDDEQYTEAKCPAGEGHRRALQRP
jgi:uncharacterized protein YPO0396